jgi:branched-chain amino acid transport system ATP-binding protein
MLLVNGISKSFGGLEVVRDLSVEVAAGECLGIMGPNGAGKSTFFDLVSGTVRASKGSVLVDGQDVTRLKASARVRAGIVRAFQVPRPFASLTVVEHLRLAKSASGRSSNPAFAVDVVLDLTGLSARRDMLGGTLRLLDRKRLELAKAICVEPKVIMLDEVSGGLTEAEVEQMMLLISNLRSLGLAVLWVEHIAHALKEVCDRVMVMHMGASIVTDKPEVVVKSPVVRKLYLGSALDA